MSEHSRVVQRCRLLHVPAAGGTIGAVVEDTFNDPLVAGDAREVDCRPAHVIPDPGLGVVSLRRPQVRERQSSVELCCPFGQRH